MSIDWKKYSIKIEKVPVYPFIHYFFEITIDLIDDQSGSLKCGEEIPIDVKLISNGDSKCDILKLESDDPKITKSGFVKLKVKLLEPSMRYDNNEFYFQVSTKDPAHAAIGPAVSDGMFAISHQLVIDGGHVPKTWFKDRGGKESYIELGVSIISSSKKLVTHRRVPLKVTLLYENEEVVVNQSILKHSPDTKLQIDSTGRTYIRFRIEEVSRNHQKQSFRLKIGPDTNEYPLNNDISPVLSDCVEVLSKPRSGKDKKEEPIMNGKRKSIENAIDLPSNKRDKKAIVSITGESDAPGLVALLAASSSVGSTRESGTTGIVSSEPCSAARKAFSDLMLWNKMVMEEILQLKWRQMGVEKMSDGSTAPLILRRNPNPTIDELVQRYNSYAEPNMKMLYKNLFNVRTCDIADHTIDIGKYEEHVRLEDLPPDTPSLNQRHSLRLSDWPSESYIGSDHSGDDFVCETIQGKKDVVLDISPD